MPVLQAPEVQTVGISWQGNVHYFLGCWKSTAYWLHDSQSELLGFIMLTEFTNCVAIKEKCQGKLTQVPYFCMTMHLLTGHTLDRLLYLNPYLKKWVIHHILRTWHQVITICFQIWGNTSVSGDFPPKSGWRKSDRLQASKNCEITITCASTKAVMMLKNKCMLIHLFYLNRSVSQSFWPPLTVVFRGWLVPSH